MSEFIDEGYVDLDKEVVLDKDGKRITEADVKKWSEEAEARSRGGRPSLSGKSSASPQIAVRVPAETRDRLKARAEREGKSLSQLAREALESYA